MYQALYRKYRPRSFDDVVGQEHVTETLRRQVASGRLSHAYLFVGTHGTGKTTCAKILSKALNCEHPVNGNPCNQCASCLGIDSGAILDVEELDGASNNGVDDIRAIRDESVYLPASVKKRVYIIDEAHMLSLGAFNALLKILEEPPEHLVFILATTETRKIPATILSRCQRFTFRRLLPEELQSRLRYVSEQEGIRLTEGAAALITRLADGAMRDALSLLDQCASDDVIDEEKVSATVGLAGDVQLAELFSYIFSGNVSSALELMDGLYNAGKEMSGVLTELMSLCRDVLLMRLSPRSGPLLMDSTRDVRLLRKLSRQTGPETLMRAVTAIQEALSAMALSQDKRTAADVCVIRLAASSGGVELEARPVFTVSGNERHDEAPKAPEAVKPAAEAPDEKQTPVRVEEERPVPEPLPDDIVPPWENLEPPPEEDAPMRFPEEETVSEQPERAIPEAKPLPVREEVPVPQENGGGWDEILAAVSPQLDMPLPMFLGDSTNVSAEIGGTSLVLHIKNDFIRNMLTAEPVLSKVREAASRVLGRAVVVTADSGEIEDNSAEKRLSELEKFGNIVKFE